MGRFNDVWNKKKTTVGAALISAIHYPFQTHFTAKITCCFAIVCCMSSHWIELWNSARHVHVDAVLIQVKPGMIAEHGREYHF